MEMGFYAVLEVCVLAAIGCAFCFGLDHYENDVQIARRVPLPMILGTQESCIGGFCTQEVIWLSYLCNGIFPRSWEDDVGEESMVLQWESLSDDEKIAIATLSGDDFERLGNGEQVSRLQSLCVDHHHGGGHRECGLQPKQILAFYSILSQRNHLECSDTYEFLRIALRVNEQDRWMACFFVYEVNAIDKTLRHWHDNRFRT